MPGEPSRTTAGTFPRWSDQFSEGSAPKGRIRSKDGALHSHAQHLAVTIDLWRIRRSGKRMGANGCRA
jgi:hypothetical protein